MNQDFQIRHGSKHYRPCNQYKHRFHYSHHRSLLGGRSVKVVAYYLIPTQSGTPTQCKNYFIPFSHVFTTQAQNCIPRKYIIMA